MSSKGTSSAVTGGGAIWVPKRRFPEFYEAGAWESVSLGSVASIRTKKVGDKTCIPMSITSGVGLVSQMEKFGRIIAGESYKNYLLLQKNDFAYNKSATKEFPEGFIALYAGEELAAVPNSIFTCFRVKEEAISPSYLNYLFLGNLHGRWLRKFIEVGARAHGSLSINDRDLLALPVPIPAGPNSLREQQKIANFLASADALIELQGRKVEALKAHKKGLMQQLFPRPQRVENGIKIPAESQPRLRFPEYEGAGDWQEAKLEDTCYLQAGKFVKASEIQENSAEGLFPCYGGNGLRGYSASFTHSGRYPLIGRQGALCGNVKFVVGKFHATEHALAASARRGISVDWLFYLLDHLDLNQFATGQAQPGLSVDVLNNVMTSVPKDEAEQQRIADCLTSLDDLIAAATKKLETLKTHKKGLMQQLFPQIGEGDA